jgi:hypothetical protein
MRTLVPVILYKQEAILLPSLTPVTPSGGIAMEWLSLLAGFILGLISSFLTSIIWERYDRNFAHPIRELQSITRRIVSALNMHARWLTSPAYTPHTGHEAAAQELRILSTELSGLIAILPVRPLPAKRLKDRLSLPWRKLKYRMTTKDTPPLEDLIEARRQLMGLSNSLYLPAGSLEDRGELARENTEAVKIIKEKLGLGRKT